MTFDQPWALSLLALVPLLWLVRHRTPHRRVMVAAPFFWTSRPQPETARWATSVARHPLVWVQTALAVALIGALAGPRVAASADTVALVLDVSMSMGARDGNGTRLAEALARARAIVAAQPPATRVVVWTAGAAPLRIGDSPAGGGLPPAVLSVEATDGWADLEAAVAVAARDASAPRRVYVVSDRRAPVRAALVEWVPVGRPVDNVALAGLVAWRRPGSPDALKLTVVLRNYGTTDQRPTLALSIAGSTLLQQQVPVPAGRTTSLTSTLPGAPSEGILTARLSVEDGLTADNVRYTLVDTPVPPRALVLGRNRFVDAALQALGVEAVQSADSPHDVVLCVSCSTAPPGQAPSLVIPPPGSPSRAVPLTVVRPDHPSVDHVTLDGLDVAPHAGQAIAEGALVIARAGGTPVLIASETDGRRLLQLNIDATDPGVGLNPAFPLLVSGIVNWLGGAYLPAVETRAGDPFVWRVRQPVNEADQLRGTDPDGRVLDVRASAGSVVVAGTATAGPYRVAVGDRTIRFVVNPASLEESDLSSPLASPATPEPGRAADAPAAASLLNLAPPLLAVALMLLLVEARIRHTMSRAASPIWPWPRIAVRVAAATLLVAALAGVRLWTGAAPIAIAFVIDRSTSTAPAWRAFEDTARRLAKSLGPSDQSGLVVFGASAAVERRVQPGVLSSNPVESQVDGSATDLENALRTARGLLPPDGSDRRLVLFTDGRQTTGDASREAALAAAEGVRIDVMPPPDSARSMTRASRVVAPAVVRVDEPFDVGVVVEGPAGTTGRLQLLGTGPPREQAVAIPPEGATAITFTVRATQPGIRAFQASFTPDVTAFDFETPQPGSVQAGAVVAVVGPMRVLRTAETALAAPGLLSSPGATTDFIAASQLPTATALSTYDAVVLDDVDPAALRPEQRTSLTQYVEGGGGLLVLGTERSLPPNPTGTADLDDILPVDSRPRSGARGSSMALVVAFDKSGSMEERVSGTSKIEYARQAVRGIVQVLPPGDAVGIIAFDGGTTTVAPLSTARDSAALDAALRLLRPEGSTAMAPALAQARTWLEAALRQGTSRRHILLISDGRTSATDLVAAREVVQGAGLVLSVVALGAGPDRAALEAVATGSGGRAYFPDDVRQLPALVAREAARVSGGRTVTSPFTARLGVHGLTRGLTGAPRFDGYVVTAARPAAEVVMRSHLDDPLLAVGRAGLGRVAVYTADIRSSWSDGFVRWPGAGDLLQRTLQWVARRVDEPSVFASLRGTSVGLEATIETTAAEGPLEVSGTLRSPTGRDVELVFDAAGEGRFLARAPLGEPGTYMARLTATADDGRPVTLLRGLYWSAPQESDVDGVDAPLLAAIAGTTGGRVLTGGTASLDDRRPGYRDVRNWFVGLALLLFLTDALVGGLERIVTLARRGPGLAPMGQAA